MALPKEPRQKMINMMYLVLTALLALNVSSEILNAFKVVDNSLQSSNAVIDKTNESILEALKEAANDPKTAEKGKIWLPRAQAAITRTGSMIAYIDTLKERLKRESDLRIEDDGSQSFKEDDLDAATRLFDVNGQGEKLKDELARFKQELAAIVPVEDQKKQKLEELPIDLSIPKTKNEATSKNWTNAYFHMTPTVAALTMLSKFQNDVKRSGNIVATYCQNQIGKIVVPLDRFEVLVSQNSEYLLPGQPLKIRAGLGAFSSAAKPQVIIGGVSRQVNDQGFAEFEENVNGGGDRTVKVSVSFIDPNSGEKKTKDSEIKYTVGTPSGASIFLTKMNVMYAGVDNPVTISAGSIKAEKMTVSFDKGTVSRSGGDNYIAKVTSLGDGTITISGEGKSFKFPIRCKKLPPPTPMVGTLKTGNVSTAAFKAMGAVRAILEDSEFAGAPFTITSYKIGGFINGEPRETQVNGPSFAGNAIVTAAKPGSAIGIYDIHAKGPDGSDYKLGDLFYNLK